MCFLTYKNDVKDNKFFRKLRPQTANEAVSQIMR